MIPSSIEAIPYLGIPSTPIGQQAAYLGLRGIHGNFPVLPWGLWRHTQRLVGEFAEAYTSVDTTSFIVAPLSERINAMRKKAEDLQRANKIENFWVFHEEAIEACGAKVLAQYYIPLFARVQGVAMLFHYTPHFARIRTAPVSQIFRGPKRGDAMIRTSRIRASKKQFKKPPVDPFDTSSKGTFQSKRYLHNAKHLAANSTALMWSGEDGV